ncbi:MAG TPA: class I SAM-dependent methyltransferase [Chloroflexia bacterium]|nr:class I SAM-dependent methyltransferase [Chloroflexia bacterium]
MEQSPKPAHLGPQYGAQFQDSSVVAAYPHRPPYPAAVFPVLAGLIRDTPRTVLDVGCGRGEIARPLLPYVDRVDAVDLSPAMVAAGQALLGGDNPHLRWIVGPAESAALDGPYALITAGASLHWMDWPVVLSRFARLLTTRGMLAIIEGDLIAPPWRAQLQPILNRYSTNRDYQPYDLTTELVARGLFAPLGAEDLPPEPYHQPVAAYVESFHARNGFSRQRMAAEDAAAFDARVAELVTPFCVDGAVPLQIGARVIWGRPGPA